MKSNKILWMILITVLVCFVGFGVYLKWDHDQDVKLAKQTEKKIDDVLASNQATLQSALESFNTVVVQKDAQIQTLEVENTSLRARTTVLLDQAAEQEAAVEPILKQFPEVAKLVFTLKETIATVQQENINLRAQLTLVQEKFEKANDTINTITGENLKLVVALQDVRADLHKVLSINKGASTGWKIVDVVFKGVVIYGVFK